MPDIKTRDIAKGTIKTIDKSAVAAERMKSAFIQTKEKAEHSVDVPESSAEEYASNRLESGIDRVSHEAVRTMTKTVLNSNMPTNRRMSFVISFISFPR